jgi:hypothetical protein
MSAIERLLERLQTGWAPRRDEIDPSISQYDMLDWDLHAYFGIPEIFIAGSDVAGEVQLTATVLWIDQHLGWALAETGFYWLYDDQESEKVRNDAR